MQKGSSKLLMIASALLFFLSVTSIDLQASEMGKPVQFGTPHFTYEQLDKMQPVTINMRPEVRGYTVQAAMTGTDVSVTTSRAQEIQQIKDMIASLSARVAELEAQQ